MNRILRGGLLAVIAGLCVVAAAPAAGYGQSATSTLPLSPSYSGDFPDPSVVWDASTGSYWAYSTQHGLTSVQVMSSPNLTTWSPIHDALPTLPSWATFGYTWAPSVAKFGTTWVMWYTARDSSSGRQCLSVATATAPGGPFTDSTPSPVICQLTDGGSIDANIFIDGTNDYLLWKSDDNAIGRLTHLWAARLSSDGVTITSNPVQVLSEDASWQAPAMEGPTMVLNGGVYYLFYGAGNWASASAAIGYATCSTPLGPCTDRTTVKPWLQSYGLALGPSGPDVFTDASGATRLAYHAWNGCVGYPNCNRALWIIPLSFTGGVPQSPPFFTVRPGLATDISVGANGSAWIVGTTPASSTGQRIYRWNGTTWAPVSGAAVKIAVDPSGNPWAINSLHQIYHLGATGWARFPGGATDISQGADGALWVIGTGATPGGFTIYHWTGAAWAKVGGAAVTVAVGPTGTPWVINSSHEIFYLGAKGWTRFSGSATDISWGADGALWVIGSVPTVGGFGIYRWIGTNWSPVPGGAVTIAVGPDGSPWVITSAHQIFAR